MANNNGIISAPGIGLEPDIYATLGVGRYNGLFDTVYICSNMHGKINPCAKFKPTRAGNSMETPSDWWRGPDGKCGFDIPQYSTTGNAENGFIHDLIYGAAAWSYLAPRPNIDYCRFPDFNGYNHNAGEIFGTIDVDTYITSTVGGTLTIRVIPPNQQAQGQLTPEDITVRGAVLSTFFLGVLLWQEEAGGIKYVIRTANTAGITASVTLPNTGITGISNWNAMLFLSSVPVDGTEGRIGDYIAARHTNAVQLEIINIRVVRQVFVSFNQWIGTLYRQAEVSMNLTNNHPTESFTFTTPQATLLKSGTLSVVGQVAAADQVVAPKSNTHLNLTMNTLISQTGGTQTFELQGTASNITSEVNPIVSINY